MKSLNIKELNFKHISFDLWLTIIRSNPEFKDKRNQLFKDFFKIELPIEKIAERIRFYDVSCNNINQKTGLNFDTFEIYYLILNSLELDINQIDTNTLNQFYLETEKLFFKYLPILCFENINLEFEYLKNNNITMNILSNTSFIKGYTLRKLIKQYDFEKYFLFQIYSDECGFSKPNLSIYELMYNEINKLNNNIKKTEILHIGDNFVSDYEGAKFFGIEALLIIH